jgi:hypothetical protein
MLTYSFTPRSARLARVGSVLVLMGVAAFGCATSPGPSPASGKADEATFMESLRQEAKAAPGAALIDADAAEARYGESQFTQERRVLAIQALVDLNRIGEARARGYDFLDRYPNGPFTARIQALTGVHPAPPMGPAQ